MPHLPPSSSGQPSLMLGTVRLVVQVTWSSCGTWSARRPVTLSSHAASGDTCGRLWDGGRAVGLG